MFELLTGKPPFSGDGVTRWSDAKTAGNVSTLAFIFGGVGLAGAATLWFTDKSSSATTRVGIGPGGIQLKGGW